jgi:hypothetical protein
MKYIIQHEIKCNLAHRLMWWTHEKNVPGMNPSQVPQNVLFLAIVNTLKISVVIVIINAVVVVSSVGGRAYYLHTDSIYIKFVRHNLKVTHYCHICN